MSPLTRTIARQAVVAIGAAVLAAWVVGNVPQLRDWIAKQWRPPWV